MRMLGVKTIAHILANLLDQRQRQKVPLMTRNRLNDGLAQAQTKILSLMPKS